MREESECSAGAAWAVVETAAESAARPTPMLDNGSTRHAVKNTTVVLTVRSGESKSLAPKMVPPLAESWLSVASTGSRATALRVRRPTTPVQVRTAHAGRT